MECTITVFAHCNVERLALEIKRQKVEDLLKSMLSDFPGPEDPQPAITEATRVAEELGGEVVFEEHFNREGDKVY